MKQLHVHTCNLYIALYCITGKLPETMVLLTWAAFNAGGDNCSFMY